MRTTIVKDAKTIVITSAVSGEVVYRANTDDVAVALRRAQRLRNGRRPVAAGRLIPATADANTWGVFNPLTDAMHGLYVAKAGE